MIDKNWHKKYLKLSLPLAILSCTFAPILPGASEPTSPNSTDNLDLPPEIIKDSPVLQRWSEDIPNVLEEIKHDPAFRTRLRLGYAQFPSSGDASGLILGVEDVFLGKTGLTIRGDYQTAFGDREAGGVDLQYYILPLGYYVNVAPVIGYRAISTQNYATDGVNLGAKLILSLSRTGAADISFTQSFVSPGGADEVGITTLAVGYAITHNLRLSTEIQKQNSRVNKDSMVGILLERKF